MQAQFSITLVAALVALPALAAEADPADAPDTITVTASRVGALVSELPTAVSVLDREALDRQLRGSTDILRALDFAVPGLNLSAGGRSQCSTRVRGRVPQFLINGVPANQELRPSNCNSAFQISPFAVERIEVVRGATALFGAGAPGGIINLITRQARSEQLEVDAVAQTGFSTRRPAGTWQTDVYAGAGRQIGRFDVYAGVGWQDYDVARDPAGNRTVGTAFESVALNGSVGFALSPAARLRATATWYSEDPGQEYNVSGAEVDAGAAFPRVTPVTPNPFRSEGIDRLYTLAVSLEADDALGHRLLASVFNQSQHFRQRANFQDFNAGEPDFFSDNRTNSTLGARLTLARPFQLGSGRLELQYGADWREDRVIRLLLDPADTRRATGFIAPEVLLTQIGLFGQGTIAFGRLRLSGGARQEWYQGRIGRELADAGLSGRGAPGRFHDAQLTLFNAGLVYRATADVQAYLSYNQGAELTQLGRAARGARNPGLISPEPAISEQYEAGVRGRLGPVAFTGAGFFSYSEAASLLQPDPGCQGQSFCPLIPLRAPQRVWGAEGTVDWAVAPQLDLAAVVTWQEGEIREASLGRFVPFSTDRLSPMRVVGRIDWRPLNRLSLSAQGSYSAASDAFSPAEQGIGRVQTPALFLADLSGAWRLGPGELTLAATNLFDRRFQNITEAAGGFTPSLAEGRRLTFGYRLRVGRP